MRHSRRTTLTTDDVDGALNLRNVEVGFFFFFKLHYNFMCPFSGCMYVFNLVLLNDGIKEECVVYI